MRPADKLEAPPSPSIVLAETYGAHNYHPLPVVLVRGEGVWVEDEAGLRYMDMLSAYSALNHGHRHPKILAALAEQAGKITLTSRAFHNDQMGPLLAQLCAHTGFESALLMNSGAEAVETAIKAARKWGYTTRGVPEGRAKILVADGNFHGRTTTIVGFSSEAQYRQGFGPFTPGFAQVPYGDTDALEAAFDEHTVAFLVEPIQGEAGIVLPPEGYLRRARELCDHHGALLFVDEIQTGLGRTGRDFGYQWSDIRVDGMTVGKALGGGVLPISAFLADRRVMDVFTPGDHGSTFGGNPLACAVARAALEVLRQERLAERAQEQGAWFIEALRGLRSPHVREVRGRGLLIGVEIHRASGPARPFCERLMRLGLLCKETHGQVIRFAPPLIVSRSDLEWAMKCIAQVLS